MAYATALAPYQPGPGTTNDGIGTVYEDVQVTGSGDTTGTWTTQFVKQPLRVLGPFTYSISGQVVTLGSASLTGVEIARVIGFP
jgi:hypothetical protein